MDHLAVADVDAHVVQVTAVEHQVAGSLLPAWQPLTGAPLGAGVVRQRSTGLAPDELRQPRAVEGTGAGGPPPVWLAQLRVRRRNRRTRGAGRCRRIAGLRWASRRPRPATGGRCLLRPVLGRGQRSQLVVLKLGEQLLLLPPSCLLYTSDAADE